MTTHDYALGELNKNITLSQKLSFIHGLLSKQIPAIARISVAVYDPKTAILKSFLHSSGGDNPLTNYQAPLDAVSSLQDIARTGKPRVVNDLHAQYQGPGEHNRRMSKQGYESSYTLPMYLNDTFFGFVFFNSYEKNTFQGPLLPTLDLYGHLISLTVINELTVIHTMLAAVRTARDMTAHRDVETGAHLDRMASYARLIAKALAAKYGFSDEYIEHLFLFAPLHDIGKISVPDSILHKQGPLDETEIAIMKRHALKGREIVDAMLSEFGLNSLPYMEVLRNIIEFHHEKLDASGYPHGLRDDRIPIEARIIAVADMFDALTSRRPYKQAWSNEEAFSVLRALAGAKLDADCINALIGRAEEIDQIQARFHSDETIPMPPGTIDVPDF